jgi:hypothetical protein
MRLGKTALFIAALLAPLFVVVSVISAGDKVTICHAAGQEGTTHFNTLNISYNAAFGPAGHFYEDGTPRAGHEQDYLGQCREESETPTPSPNISPILECVEGLSEGQYQAYFGYENRTGVPVTVAIGDSNKITGGGLSGINQGQTEDFNYPVPGHPDGRLGRTPFYPPGPAAFSVNFDGTNLVWNLLGHTSTASRSSKVCPTPTPTPPCEETQSCPTTPPSPTPTPTPPSCGADEHLNSEGTKCLKWELGGPPPPPAVTTTGQVLGATTMAGTGAFEENLFSLFFSIGALLMGAGIRKNALSSRKAN